jgi:signal transduction histidine kinase/DNA-binding response OmpR family regulator
MRQIHRPQQKTDPGFSAMVEDLQRSTGRSILFSILTVCLAVFFFVVITSPFSWPFWLVMGIALFSCAASYLLLNRSIGVSHLFLIAGLLFSIGLAIWYFPVPEIFLLYAFLPMLSAVTVGWRAALFTEAAVLGMYLFLSPHTPFAGDPGLYFLFLAAGGALGALLGWSSIRSMFTVVSWSTYHSDQAQQNMEEARRHRGQMVQVLKDLDLAYYRLERANAALAAAWSAAEEAERFKTEFVTNISHELRTPLNLIVGFSEMMLTSPESYDRMPLPGPYRSDLHSIFQSAQHLLALVDDILDLSRIEVGKITLNRADVDPVALVNETAAMVTDYIQTKGLDLRIEASPEIPALWIDPLRIRQVMLNLLVNAARFTERGWIRVAIAREGENVRVTVTDTGKGIPAQDIPKVFEAFRTTEQPISAWHSGTGLGLPISKKFVELHRGQMGVESPPEGGTTFWFSLPCIQTRVPKTVRIESSTAPPPAAYVLERILIMVSDDPHRAGLIHRYLPEYRIARVADLAEGIALAMESRADAILTDQPVGDFPGTCEVPIIYCPLPNEHREAIARGASDLLIKPVSAAELMTSVERLKGTVRRVLIADEDPDLARLFRRMLRGRFEDDQILEAYHGEEVERLMGAAHPDVLILSDALPGMEWKKYAGEGAEKTAVILVSSGFPIRAPNPETGPLEIFNPGGFLTSEALQIVQGILHVLAPGRILPPSRESAPEAAPVG